MKRVKTGVSGLDELIGGGIPEKSVVLVSGGAGTGKTILSLQFLASGAAKGEKGAYFTFEERDEKIREQAMQFDWRFAELEKQKKLVIKSVNKRTLSEIMREINAVTNEFKPKRIVLDSMTTLSLYAHTLTNVTDVTAVQDEEAIYGAHGLTSLPPETDGLIVRRILITLVKMLQAQRITALVTSELGENSQWFSRDTLSEFACDGLLVLRATSLGKELHRTIEVRKMRNTPIKGGVHNIAFTRKGIVVET
ncbi:MAG: RAD55 family ATPase [Candidatus Micrarchaeia archaeon]